MPLPPVFVKVLFRFRFSLKCGSNGVVVSRKAKFPVLWEEHVDLLLICLNCRNVVFYLLRDRKSVV